MMTANEEPGILYNFNFLYPKLSHETGDGNARCRLRYVTGAFNRIGFLASRVPIYGQKAGDVSVHSDICVESI